MKKVSGYRLIPRIVRCEVLITSIQSLEGSPCKLKIAIAGNYESLNLNPIRFRIF